ncbi:MAG: anaerobic sulfatase maturase [Bacteroidaceae bacterium]|nr:anaerobic sulfatase maturase [Bacteroidaceae bacterium]
MKQNDEDSRHYAIEVKPIGAACNLRCDYCYYLGKSSEQGGLMSDEVLESYIQQVVAIHGLKAEIEFAWHGGEPTLCGIPFFERAMQLQEKYAQGRRILNTLQTNGTMLTDEWCQFFKEHHFRIGISIDGPEHLHNIYRKDAKDEGTFHQVMRGVELLQKHGVEFNTLTTVNAVNAAHAKEVYNFLREFSDFMQFLPVVERTHPQSSALEAKEGSGRKWRISLPPGLYSPLHDRERVAPFSVPAEAYGRFLCTILDEWGSKDVGRKFVQTFEATLGNLTRRPAGLCVHEAVCGHCGVIEKNGDLYRCDRYVFPEYRIGNILNESLGAMMQTNRQFGEFKLDSLPRSCLHCDVADLCFGGCPKDRLVDKLTLFGTEYRNYLCPGYRMFFRYFKQRIKDIIMKNGE